MTHLWELAHLFLRLGATAFGGPAAHVALLREEVVRRRGWLTDRQFLDYIAAANMIPGPNSTETVMHVGHTRAGLPGMVTAGICFIIPAALIVSALAAVYVRTAELPQARWLMYGVAPVVIAIVVDAVIGLARSALRTTLTVVAAAVLFGAAVAGVNELVLLVAAGIAFLLLRAGTGARRTGRAGIVLLIPAIPIAAGAAPAVAASATPLALAAFFLKVGSILFGTGYVLVAYLQRDLVERWQWLTNQQLLDAVAVGQFTPGPVLTTATFIGYVLGGATGAVVSTVAIFLPAFVFVALTHPVVARLRSSHTASALLEGVTIASLALMAAAAWTLGRSALIDLATVTIAVASAAILLTWRPNSVWLILGGAAAGWGIHSLRAAGA